MVGPRCLAGCRFAAHSDPFESQAFSWEESSLSWDLYRFGNRFAVPTTGDFPRHVFLGTLSRYLLPLNLCV